MQPDRALPRPPSPTAAVAYQSPPNIADQFEDLLALLDRRKRLGMISWMSVRYYDGWRPGRDEVADLVAVELGTLTFDEYVARRHRRKSGDIAVADITPMILRRQRQLDALAQWNAVAAHAVSRNAPEVAVQTGFLMNPHSPLIPQVTNGGLTS